MILTRQDLHYYIKADFEAQEMTHPLMARFTYGENWAMFKYMKTLRKLEYYESTSSNYIHRVLRCYYLLKHRRQALKYNMYIYPNVVGEGLKIIHPGFRRIDRVVKSLGKNCTILPMVLFGKKTPDTPSRCITVGDNCYFGTGCTILGPVRIGNNVIVGAGAVVTKDIPDGCVVAGVPARIINRDDNMSHFVKGT